MVYGCGFTCIFDPNIKISNLRFDLSIYGVFDGVLPVVVVSSVMTTVLDQRV